VLAQTRLEPGGGDPLLNRGALAAGDDEGVEALQVGGSADLDGLGTEPAQRAGVRLEVALQR